MGASIPNSSQKWLFLLVAAWLLPGLIGHDPWKPDEAYTFGLIYHILETGDWLVPTLAGEPFMEKPPVYFITAALFAKLFGWLLPLHDAARLASAFYVVLTLYCVAKTAGGLYGEDRRWPAALFLLACLGYVQHAHLLLTDNALVAGVAMALYGFSITLARPLAGGLLVGTGTGIAFLSKGLIGPGLLGLIALALLAFPAWRNRAYVKSWPVALAAFAPWALIWPWLLYREAPQLFHEWFWVQNFGRFSGEAKIGGVPDHWHYVKALPWFALPAWPLAAWSVFSLRKNILTRVGMQLPLVAFFVMFAVLSASSLARQLYALPMLVPLAILATARLDTLPAWLAWPLDKLAVWGAGLGAAVLWLLWFGSLRGWPGDYVSHVAPETVIPALALTGLWIYSTRIKDLAVHWAAAIMLTWGLAMTLWLPYLDYTKTYRGVIADMQKHRPATPGCVAGRDLSEPQRAMLHYFAGIKSIRETVPAALICPLLLIHTSDDKPPANTAHLKLLWRGSRPGDDKERLWLFAR